MENEETTEAGEQFETELDLGQLTDSDLVELEALLVQDYQDQRQSEEFDASDADQAEELSAIVSTIKEVRAEMKSRAEFAEMDAEVAEVAGEEFIAKAHQSAPDGKYGQKEYPGKRDSSGGVKQGSQEEGVTKDPYDAFEQVEEDEDGEEELAKMPAALKKHFEDKEDGKEEAGYAKKEEEFDIEEKKTVNVISPKGLEGDKAPAVESVEDSRSFGVTAGADIRGFAAGKEFSDWGEVARAFVAKRPDIRAKGSDGDGNQTLVASVKADFPEERILTNDIDTTMAKINAVASQEAITASGGLCAPLTPYYQLTTYGDACRPVRDSLPQFQAERGGIRFLPAPILSDLSGSVRVTTAAEDAAGYTNQTPPGTTAPKPCLQVTCEAEQTCIIEAISRCLQFGNMGSRTYPEQVEAWIKLGMAEFARTAETQLLDGIEAASTAITGTQAYGATEGVLEQIALLVTNFRSRNRLCNETTMRAIMPWWVKEVFRQDIARQAPGDGLNRFSVSDAQIADWFSARGIQITYYQDNTTAAGAPFAAPTATNPIPTWPTTFQWFLFPEGSFVYLDGGALDLGLVRDSTLNSQNDYTIFYEEFNGLCFIGRESYSITSTFCPTGSYAEGTAAITC